MSAAPDFTLSITPRTPSAPRIVNARLCFLASARVSSAAGPVTSPVLGSVVAWTGLLAMNVARSVPVGARSSACAAPAPSATATAISVRRIERIRAAAALRCVGRRFLGLALDLLTLLGGGAGARGVDPLGQVHVGAEADIDRIARADVLRVPMRAVAHRGDRALGGAEQLADLRVGELGVVLQQPRDAVGLVLALADRRVAGSLGARLRHRRLGLDHAQPRFGIGLAALDVLGGELSAQDRIE